MSEYDKLVAAPKERLSAALTTPLTPARREGLPDKPFVSLTEALTWMAFGVAIGARDFHFADEYRIGPFADQDQMRENLADAMARFVGEGSAGRLKVRGRYLVNYNDHDARANADTDYLTDTQLKDFARFDSLRGGLERGEGLFWETLPIERILHGKGDGWRDVEVCRQSLLTHIPMAEQVPTRGSGDSGGNGGDDFGPEARAELSRFAEEATKDEWWTWPEAIAWAGTRDVRTVATLRYWAQWWMEQGDDDPSHILGGQILMARRHAGTEDRAGSDVESDLMRAVEHGRVGSVGRTDPDAWSRPLDKGHWRGGAVSITGGTANLVSAANAAKIWAYDVAINRDDLLSAFPEVSEDMPGKTTAKAERDCLKWLIEAFAQDPEKKRNKRSFQDDALITFNGRLGVRGFMRVWDTIARDAGRSEPGRKS